MTWENKLLNGLKSKYGTNHKFILPSLIMKYMTRTQGKGSFQACDVLRTGGGLSDMWRRKKKQARGKNGRRTRTGGCEGWRSR
jgi:hypothetical protein